MAIAKDHAQFDQQLLTTFAEDSKWYLRAAPPRETPTGKEFHAHAFEQLRDVVGEKIDERSYVVQHACHLLLMEAVQLHSLSFSAAAKEGGQTNEQRINDATKRIEENLLHVHSRKVVTAVNRSHPLRGHYKGVTRQFSSGRTGTVLEINKAEATLAQELKNPTSQILRENTFLRECSSEANIAEFYTHLRTQLWKLLSSGVTFFNDELRLKFGKAVTEEWIESLPVIQKRIDALGLELGIASASDASDPSSILSRLNVETLTREQEEDFYPLLQFCTMLLLVERKYSELRQLTDTWLQKLIDWRIPQSSRPQMMLAIVACLSGQAEIDTTTEQMRDRI